MHSISTLAYIQLHTFHAGDQAPRLLPLYSVIIAPQ